MIAAAGDRDSGRRVRAGVAARAADGAAIQPVECDARRPGARFRSAATGIFSCGGCLVPRAAFPCAGGIRARRDTLAGAEVYDAALASQDAIRGVPRAYACAMLLVSVMIVPNLSAILLRNRLRDRYRALDP